MPPARGARVERSASSTRGPGRRLSRAALVRSLAAASDARVRRRLLARAPHLHDGDLVAQLNQAALAAVHVSLDRADHLASAARSIASRVGDDRALARSLRTSGHVLALRGEYRRAMANYRSALDLLASPADASERAVTLSGALQSLIYLGDYQKADAFAAEARAVFETQGDRVRLGRLESNVGNVLYRQDRFADALACYRRAYAALAEKGEPTDVGIVLRNIAVCWISLNDFGAALQAYGEARAWCERYAMPRLAAENDYNIAYLHYLRGEYARAIELYRATRAYCERVGDPYHEALCDLDQSEIYLELNLNGEGEHLATAACRAFQALHMRYEMGKALVNIGAAAARSGEPGRALERFAEARAVFSEERNRHWLTITDLYRALVLLQQGNDAGAERLCRSALAYFREQGPPGKAALCEMMLARLAVRAGRLADARETTERAIGRAERGEATPLAAEGYFLLGEIHEAMGDSEAAYAAVRQAHAGLETLRSQIAGEQLKISFLDDKRAVYEALVSLALRREPPILRARVAFRYIEQAKSRSLADLMAFGSPLADPAGGRGAVSNLRRELTSWYRKIESHEGGPGPDPGAGGLAFMRERARDCEARLVRAEAKLEHADAEYRVLAGGAALPLEAIRSSIPADAAVVEYYEARGRLLGCVLSHSRLEIVPLGPVGRVRELLRLLQFQLSKFSLHDGYAARFASPLLAATLDHLHELHSLLVAPLLPFLSTARHLVIVPHRFLHYLPFHALFDGNRFLLDDFWVSYAPSATVYYLCRSRAGASESHSLVLGVPDPRAPYILDEVQAVSAALPEPRVYVGDQATDARLREDGAGARYVHVATHGMFRQDNPMFSAVRLGNGEMSLMDLYELRFAADLVTLSGCGTGLSAVVGGDELVGLVRGLLYAGARALLVTLWDVNDRSTALFMRSFYTKLRATSDKRVAMIAAVREVRAQYAHPYFWAPFVLVGDAGGPRYISSSRDDP